jgi:hypothetical protein
MRLYDFEIVMRCPCEILLLFADSCHQHMHDVKSIRMFEYEVTWPERSLGFKEVHSGVWVAGVMYVV